MVLLRPVTLSGVLLLRIYQSQFCVITIDLVTTLMAFTSTLFRFSKPCFFAPSSPQTLFAVAASLTLLCAVVSGIA